MRLPRFSSRRSRTYGELNNRGVRSRRPWRLKAKPVITALLALAAAGFIFFTAVVAWVSRDLPDPNKLAERQVAESTKIYDRTGAHLLYEVFQNEKRTVVDLAGISPWAIKATVAVEDKHFYEHKGIRLISILRAGANNLIGRRRGSGGGSTLTQQLIKNTIVGNERSIFRKIKEAILALRLERKYSKDEILKLYLNEIPYGSTNYGIEAAAQSYFHKSAKDLTIAEAATLAALPKAPSRYLNNVNALRLRRDYIIALLLEQGYISSAQKDEAQSAALRLYRNNGIFDAPHFVLYVKQLLADRFGEKLVDTGGLKVITSLDYDKQKLAEKIVTENGNKFAKEANANNASLVAIEPKSAQILALVGSRDFNNEAIDGQFNVAALGKLQPGSSFKPFVYAAAFEKGYTPDTVLYDVSTDFDARGDAKYIPKNYDNKEHGLVTMRTALQGSLNIPAVKTMYLVGYQNTIDFAKRFGYTTFTGDYGLTLVLGGGEVNLLEHTNAYATLANGGTYREPASILKVTSPSGEKLYEWQASDGQEAVKPELAALVSSVLSDNAARAFIFGAVNNLILPDRAVAAKTGTTQNSRDAWTMGYVPQLAAGVWVGNTPKPKPMKGGGNKLAGVIWNQFMRQALKDAPPEAFPSAPANDAAKPVLRGGTGGITLPINRLTGRIAVSSTPENLIVPKTFLPPHDILHYVIKDDPRGEMPPSPGDDPQYEIWEQALKSWLEREQQAGRAVTTEEPPTEYDAPQSPELAPTLEIISPAPNQIFNTRALAFSVRATAPRGIASVSYFIDDLAIGTTAQFPFNYDYYAQQLTRGTHRLKIIAQDDLGNSASVETTFDLEAEFDPPNP